MDLGLDDDFLENIIPIREILNETFSRSGDKFTKEIWIYKYKNTIETLLTSKNQEDIQNYKKKF